MIKAVRIRADHVAIAVRSIDRAYEFFTRYFPTLPRNPRRFDQQVSGSFQWQDLWLGGFSIEMIEELPAGSAFIAKFIEKRGEGMHHLSFDVDNLKPMVEALRRDGVRIVDKKEYPDGNATAFISPRSAFGTLIQLWQRPDYDNPGPEQPAPAGLAIFDHAAIAVKDIRKAYDFFTRHLDATILHEPLTASDAALMLGHVEVGGFKLEFVQSPGSGSANDFVGKFIQKFGEGMHHVTIQVKEFDTILAKLRNDGVRIIDSNPNWVGQRQFYISPSSAFGMLIQVWEWL